MENQKTNNEELNENLTIKENLPTENLENDQEGLENNSSENINDPKLEIQRVEQAQAEIEKIENNIEHTKQDLDKIREELGLSLETETPPSLKKQTSKLESLKKYVNNAVKALALSGIMFGANNEAFSQNNKESVDISNWMKQQYSLVESGKLEPGTLVQGPDGRTYKIAADINTDLFKLNKKESLDGPNDLEEKKLNISSYFKTGTVEFVDGDAKEKVKKDIGVFLDSVKDLSNSTIKVVGTYSSDREWGKVSPEHPHGDKNTEIAKARKDVCLNLLLEVLKEKFPNVSLDKLIDSESKGVSLSEHYSLEEISQMSPLEREKAIDLLEGMSLEIKKLSEKISNSEMQDYLNAGFVLLDVSHSMQDDLQDAIKTIKSMNKDMNKDIKTIIIEGGNKENHLNSLLKLLNNIDESSRGKDILLLTDEPDNVFSGADYDEKINDILKQADEKGVNIILKLYNPNMNEGSKSLPSDIKIKLTQDSKYSLKQIGDSPGSLQQWYNNNLQNNT